MKNIIRTALAAGAVLGVFGAAHARAQVLDPIQFRTTFPFTVGETTVPAGAYTIKTPDDENGILELTSSDGKIGVFFPVEGVTPQTPTKNEVVFKRYGDHYVLKDVFLEGETTGAEAVMSRAETRHARKNGTPTEHRQAANRVEAPPSAQNQK